MKYALWGFLLLTVGCGPASQKLTRISLGMTKSEVIQEMGQPVSISAKEGIEYLNYRLSEIRGDMAWPYFVRIRNGVVDAYGRLGDFDSTKPEHSQVDLNINK